MIHLPLAWHPCVDSWPLNKNVRPRVIDSSSGLPGGAFTIHGHHQVTATEPGHDAAMDIWRQHRGRWHLAVIRCH